jgi:hypothetical protein
MVFRGLKRRQLLQTSLSRPSCVHFRFHVFVDNSAVGSWRVYAKDIGSSLQGSVNRNWQISRQHLGWLLTVIGIIRLLHSIRCRA